MRTQKIQIFDNSGAATIRLYNDFKKLKKIKNSIGCLLQGSTIKQKKNIYNVKNHLKHKINKSTLLSCGTKVNLTLITLKSNLSRKNGTKIRSDQTRGVILSNDFISAAEKHSKKVRVQKAFHQAGSNISILGNTIHSPVLKELRTKKNFGKIISLAKKII